MHFSCTHVVTSFLSLQSNVCLKIVVRVNRKRKKTSKKRGFPYFEANPSGPSVIYKTSLLGMPAVGTLFLTNSIPLRICVLFPYWFLWKSITTGHSCVFLQGTLVANGRQSSIMVVLKGNQRKTSCSFWGSPKKLDTPLSTSMISGQSKLIQQFSLGSFLVSKLCVPCFGPLHLGIGSLAGGVHQISGSRILVPGFLPVGKDSVPNPGPTSS